jgi:1-pyrroline-5-carboxylate dehydrogenase
LDFRAPEQHGDFEEVLERVRSGLGRSYPLVIGGEEVDRDETFASINPAHPGEVIGRQPVERGEDVDAAVMAVAAAFPEWSQTPTEERAALMFDVPDRNCRAAPRLRRPADAGGREDP